MTPAQRRLLHFIRDYRDDTGLRGPTMGEIATMIGASLNAVQVAVRTLERDGRVQRLTVVEAITAPVGN